MSVRLDARDDARDRTFRLPIAPDRARDASNPGPMPDADPHGGAAAQRARVDARDDVALAELRCPKSWQIYFPDVSYDARDRRAELTRGLSRFLTSPSGRAFVREVRQIDVARGG